MPVKHNTRKGENILARPRRYVNKKHRNESIKAKRALELQRELIRGVQPCNSVISEDHPLVVEFDV